MPRFGRGDRGLLLMLMIVLVARPEQQPLEVAHHVEHVLGLSVVPAFELQTVAVILYCQANLTRPKLLDRPLNRVRSTARTPRARSSGSGCTARAPSTRSIRAPTAFA